MLTVVAVMTILVMVEVVAVTMVTKKKVVVVMMVVLMVVLMVHVMNAWWSLCLSLPYSLPIFLVVTRQGQLNLLRLYWLFLIKK